MFDCGSVTFRIDLGLARADQAQPFVTPSRTHLIRSADCRGKPPNQYRDVRAHFPCSIQAQRAGHIYRYGIVSRGITSIYVLLLLTRQLTKELNSMGREQFECLMTQSNEVAGAPPFVEGRETVVRDGSVMN